MAYNNYFPQFYPSAQPQYVPQVQTPQPHNNGITWVQGENSAKSYPVGAGQSILLMDSENPIMYIKNTDQSGMPLPLRIFDYKERTQARSESTQTVAEPKVDYISREEFNAFREAVREEIKQVSKPVTTAKPTSKEK